MKLTIKDTKGNDQGELEVKFPLIEDGKGTQAVHDVVVAYQAAQRMGTASTKTATRNGSQRNASASLIGRPLSVRRRWHRIARCNRGLGAGPRPSPECQPPDEARSKPSASRNDCLR